MSVRNRLPRLAALTAGLFVLAAQADVINENFNGVTGTGGGIYFFGSGFNWVDNWDNGLTGEFAFAGTAGYCNIGAASAFGNATAGVGGTGAGVLNVTGVNFNLVNENFNFVVGTGGGLFLGGDGTPNTGGYAANWDDGIFGEAAFGGTYGGAAIQTGGGAEALGLPAGDAGGLGAGRIRMSNVTLNGGNWYAGLQWEIGQLPGAAVYGNPNFDDGGTAYWQPWNNAFVVPGYDVPVTPDSGDNVLKMWGQFSGGYNTSGIFQSVAARPGQTWSLAAVAQTVSTDSILGSTNHVDIAIEFYDAGGVQLDAEVMVVLDGTSQQDTWLPAGPVTAVAPAGTVTARAAMSFVQPDGLAAGSGLIDTTIFTVIAGPPSVDLTQHTLSAKVKGVANGGAGETLGDYQLRLEDADGDRLVFYGTANGAWQSIGGPLSTAVETDATGTPAAGVFNANSASFKVILAFDDHGVHAWGRGGTLDINDLLLSNSDTTGATWYAGLHWSDLLIPAGSLSDYQLTADVLGSVVGGGYVLRIEAFTDQLAGLDEDFNAVTGDCGGGACIFLDPNAVTGGTQFNYTTNYDSALTGEAAYGGVYGGTTLWAEGFSARGLTSGGNPGGKAEIRVDGIINGPEGSGWYAGLNWTGQSLASTDLSQVVMECDLRGEAVAGGQLGAYEFRIEDQDGDRMYFAGTATNNWVHIGGALSTATFGTTLSGTSNGVFDLDSASFNVVIAFASEADTWLFGGVIQIDNLFLTPATLQDELGQLSFSGVSNGNWQEIGGLLSAAESTFINLDEDFNAVTAVGGGEFYASGGSVTFGGLPWDTGIEGEEVFGGRWGSGAMSTVSAAGCATCGVGGTGGGYVDVTGGAGGASGGWWAGLSWVVSPPDFSDLSQVYLLGDVKSSKTGVPFQLRIEDYLGNPSNPTWLAFTHTPTTTGFEPVGGPLSAGVPGCPSGNCGTFNFNAATYRATLVFSGGTFEPAWGSGGTLTLDNLYLTGIGFFDADHYTVTLTFADEMSTWGTAGQLKLDNLYLGPPQTACPGDTNCNGQVDFADINPFVNALLNHVYCDGSGANVDTSGNGTIGFEDINPFVALLTQNPLPMPCD